MNNNANLRVYYRILVKVIFNVNHKRVKRNIATLVIVAIAFIAISFFLVSSVLTNEDLSRSIFLVVFFSFGIYGSITTVSTCISSILKAHKIMGTDFYSISKAGLWLSLYRLLGVALFRKSLLLFYWGKKENRIKFFNGKEKGLLDFLNNSQKAEFGHIVSFAILFFITLLFAITGHLKYTITILIINIFGNIYPIILQRYNQNRVYNLLKVTTKKQSVIK